MEERDVKASPRMHQGQTSLTTPHPTTLPSMHAPHSTATQQQPQHQTHPYPSTQQTQYASASSAHPPQPQQYYYDQRDAHHVPYQQQHQHQHHQQQQQQQQQQQYEHRPAAPQTHSSVSLPPIQHFDGPATTATSTSSSMSGQTTHAPPPQHGAPTHQAHPYPQPQPNGEAQHQYHPPPPPPHYQQQHPSMYNTPYAQPHYAQYANGAMHQPLPPSAMMPSNAPRYGMPTDQQMDPRQMSGGRHKKEVKRRTKTGCLTCRKRRIKCDERHPNCKNCEKSKRECLGYDPVFKSQPSQPALQPAPMPNHMKPEHGYYHTYQSSEHMYAPPPPQQAAMHAGPPALNGAHLDHSAGPLADGDHNRGQPHVHPSPPETVRKD